MKKIIKLCQQIIRKNEIKLDPERTRLFGKLIPLIKKGNASMPEDVFLDKNDVTKLRQVFLVEQMCIEKYWSQKIISSKNPLFEIALFPFYQGYVSTAQYLYNTMAIISHKPIKKVLYIGAGALPLNSILIAQNYNLKIDNIERENESFRLSKVLLHKLKLNNQVKVIHKDILDYKKLKDYDVIICAVLVGNNTKQKQKIIDHIGKYMKFGNLLLLKNIDGLRTLLYPPIDTSRLPKSLNIEAIHKKQSELTNMLIVARKVLKNDKDFDENDQRI